MAKEINHWCVVCGKGYHACDSCSDVKSYAPWRTLTDTIVHFAVFKTLKDYNNKLISKEEAKKLLSNTDLSDKDTFKDNIKRMLDEIFMEENIVVDTPKEKKTTKNKQEKTIGLTVVNSEDKNNYE